MKKPKHLTIEWITVENIRAYLEAYHDILSLNKKLNPDEDSDEFGDILVLDPHEQRLPENELIESSL